MWRWYVLRVVVVSVSAIAAIGGAAVLLLTLLAVRGSRLTRWLFGE